MEMAAETFPAEERRTFHLVGVGVNHSIAPPMHNFITQSLGLPWTFYSTECPRLEDALELARRPSTVGLVVTMPYKNAIMPRLDALDELAATIGACNNVYRDPGSLDLLRGTNTDWLGVRGCLLEKAGPIPRLRTPALVVGAGGASRAAVYALVAHFQCPVIYVLNRDEDEVAALVRDAQRLPLGGPRIVHVRGVEEANSLETPYYIVGTIPDFVPKTPDELKVRACLEAFMGRPDGEKGVLLDMCFKPRRTRMIKLAEKLGWPAVEGTHVIGHQIEEQYRLWAGEEKMKNLDKEGAWNVLMDAAEKSPGINF